MYINVRRYCVRRIACVVAAVRGICIPQLQDARRPVDSDGDAGVVIDHLLVMIPEHVDGGFRRVENRADEAKRRSSPNVQIWSSYDFR